MRWYDDMTDIGVEMMHGGVSSELELIDLLINYHMSGMNYSYLLLRNNHVGWSYCLQRGKQWRTKAEKELCQIE